jgi:two-component system, NarL family, sensor kinase
VLAAVGLLLAVVEVVVYATHPPLTYHADRAAVELWQYATQGSALVVAGLLVLARRVAPTVGWLLLGPAVLFMVAACLSTGLRFSTTITPAVQAAVYAEYLLWQAPRIAFIVLPLCFPYGRLPRGRARWFAVLLAAMILVHETGELLTITVWHPGSAALPNALYVSGLVPVVAAVIPWLEPAMFAGVLLATLSPVIHWRGASAVQRRQIAVVVPVFLLFLLEEWVRAQQTWSLSVEGCKIALGVLGPATLAYSVLRDRLYDLDRAARRVIGVAVPLVLLAAVYAAAATTVSLVPPGGGVALPALLAVLAALAGLVLRPAARWVQQRVDRLLYGDRAEPYELVRRLAGSLRDGADAAQMPLAVCQIVVSALRLPGAALTAGDADRPRRLAQVGAADGLEPIPLRYQGTLVGHLLVAPRSGEEALDQLDLAALQPLVDLAAPAVSAILLAEELASSRARVVSAREQERSLLRQEVHDGVGPSLAAIRLQVDTAVALLPADSPSGSLLVRASGELGEALAEFRRVTDSLRPPVLDERGLAAALAELAGRLSTPGLPIRYEAPALPAVPAAVELAAYRIAAEAMTNAIRHAAAGDVAVTLSVADEAVVLTVSDDGIGLARGARRGVGLASMAQRAADVGGVCDLTAGPGGTTVTARLPLRSDPALIEL